MTEKAEALEALSTARKMLASPEPLTDLRRSLLSSTLAFAEMKVSEIYEVRRRRRAPQETPVERLKRITKENSSADQGT